MVALDKYANAPAMHVAHRSHVLSMLDGDALEAVIREENPDYIIPEIEKSLGHYWKNNLTY